MTGKLIVIDGNDGSGKQTQAEFLRSLIVRTLREAMVISFPMYEGTFFGRELRKALDGAYGDFVNLDPHLASIPYAADRWKAKPIMEEALASGKYVICDRYVSANQIHQGGKIGDVEKREEFLSWLDQMEYGEFGMPQPDISVYLDVPPAVSEKLMSDKTRDEVEKNPDYLENSHRSAQWLIKRNPDKWIHIRCTISGIMRSREDIHEAIFVELRSRGLV